jgi:hypothetical protein
MPLHFPVCFPLCSPFFFLCPSVCPRLNSSPCCLLPLDRCTLLLAYLSVSLMMLWPKCNAQNRHKALLTSVSHIKWLKWLIHACWGNKWTRTPLIDVVVRLLLSLACELLEFVQSPCENRVLRTQHIHYRGSVAFIIGLSDPLWFNI